MTKILAVFLTGLLFGAVSFFAIEWTYFRPVFIPIPHVSSQKQNPTALPAGISSEWQTPLYTNPCVDLNRYICSMKHAEDPTGSVKPDIEGEVEALRIYEQIIRSHKRISPEKVDELLVKKIYTPQRTKQMRKLFEKVKKHLLNFIESQPFDALSSMEKLELRKRIERVILELPPPASVYEDEPDLFTRNNVYYERTRNSTVRIRVGGALLFTIQSQFNLAFTLSHELAHAIDPCELHFDQINILSYKSLAECFGSFPLDIERECSPEGMLSEIFADWAATHVVASILQENTYQFTHGQIRSAVYSSVRDLCPEHDQPELLRSEHLQPEFLQEVKATKRDGNATESNVHLSDVHTTRSNVRATVRNGNSTRSKNSPIDNLSSQPSGLSSSHPSVAFRINQIFAQHPQIRKFLGCRESTGPVLPGLPSYCFWSKGTSKGGRK